MRALLVATLFITTSSVYGNCPNACSQHGDCTKQAMCKCHGEWMGADCSLRVCSFGRAYIDSPAGDLDGDGKLSPSRAFNPLSNWKMVSKNNIVGGESEMSFTNYGYARKNSTIPWNEAHFYRECSNKGNCDRETGQCQCFPGFTGGACERLACPKDCSGHGRCRTIRDERGDKYSAWDIDSSQVCKCDPGFSGPDCSQRICPPGADPVANAHTVTNSLHGIYWRTIAGDVAVVNSTQGKMNFLKDKPSTVYYTITYTDEYGDTWTTSLLSIKYMSFCTEKGYCLSTPEISATSRLGFKKGKTDVLSLNLKALTENLNASLAGLPKSSTPEFYVWSSANIFEAYCDETKSNPSSTTTFGRQTGSIATKLNDAAISGCSGKVQLRNIVSSDATKDGYLVHPSANSKTNSLGKEVFVDGPDFRLDEEASKVCRYFEQPLDSDIQDASWRADVNRISFDGTDTTVFGACSFILAHNQGVAADLRVNYFYEPRGRMDGVPASTFSDPVQTASGGSDVKFATIRKQTTGALTYDSLSRNEDVVVVQSLNGQRVWNPKDGDVSKKFISTKSADLPQCSKRGLCNTGTGVCNCFAGFNGLRCETRHAIAYSY